ncbi:hypothetical protein Vretifemale_18196, partial [Volvox reticuliferus]
FTEADVRALCDVGASSKAAAKQQCQQQQPRLEGEGAAEGGGGLGLQEGGQTGEKGIGFKSVFALSDEPAVFSNGFAFGFDAQDPTGLGYVLPRPLDSTRDPTTWSSTAAAGGTETTAVPAPPPTGWGTIILLPAAQRLLTAPAGSPPPSLDLTKHNQHQLYEQHGGSLGTAGAPTTLPKPSAGPPTKAKNVAAVAPAAAAVAAAAAAGGGGGGSGYESGGNWFTLAAGLVAQVRPGVLLFLRRVRQLEVVDELTGVRHTLRRVDRDGGTVVEVTWCVEALGPGGSPCQGGVLRETVHTWIVGAVTLAPPLVTRGSAGVRPPATTVKVALPLPPNRGRRSSSP